MKSTIPLDFINNLIFICNMKELNLEYFILHCNNTSNVEMVGNYYQVENQNLLEI